MKRIKTYIALASAMFLCIQSLQGQELEGEERILLHGIVMDAATQQAMSNVHYIISKTLSGATGEEGKFSMYITRYDTLVFSFIGYSDVTFTLNDTLAGKSFVAGIFMEADTLSVGEVVVLPRMSDLRTEFRNTSVSVSQELINAQNNLEVATYQGLTSEASLGDPATNYEVIKRKQVITAYEKGGIPSDKILGLNIISVLPIAIYLLKNGLPEKPAPPRPHVSDRELDKIIKLYKQSLLEAKRSRE